MRIKKTEDLLRLLEAVENGQLTLEELLSQYPEQRDEIIDIFGLVSRFQNISLPEPRSQFQKSARTRLLTTMQGQEVVTIQTRLRHIWQSAQLLWIRRPVMTIALIVALVLSLVGGGTAYASLEAIPGDILYPVKIQIEDLQLTATQNQVNEDLYLQLAEERVEEVRALIDQGRYEDIPTAMTRLEHVVNRAAETLENAPEKGRPETITGFSSSLSMLAELLDQVPDAAKPGLEKATEAINRVQDRLSGILPGDVPNQVDEGKPETIPADLPTQAEGEKPVDLPADKPAELPVNPQQGKPEELPTAVPTVDVPVQPEAPALPVDPSVPPIEVPVTPVDPPTRPTAPPVVTPPVEPPAPGGRP
jgi:hypothetical protein